MAGRHRDWTQEEHILAFNLYFETPFGKARQGAVEIIE